MTPSKKGHIRSKRGADKVDTAEKLRIQTVGHTLPEENAAFVNQLGFLRPQINKKRSKRRQRGKNHESSLLFLEKEETSFPNKSIITKSKKRRKKRTKVFFNADSTSEVTDKKAQLQPEPQYNNKSYTPRTQKNALYAALDLGTNNCRLLIATPTKPGHFRVIDAFSRIVRLGEDLSSTGVLSETAMDRAIEALKVCAEKLNLHTLRASRLIATEACRSAQNGEHFIKRVKLETGLELEVIERETEARLAVSGCGTLVEQDTNAIVLFDIGGGSSEIALIDLSKKHSPRLADHITAWTSLPVGVVSLAELFGGDIVNHEDFFRMKAHVLTLLEKFADRHKLGNLTQGPGFHLLGTSGTVTTLAGLHLDLEKYDRRRVDGIWLNNKEVIQMTEKLLSWDLAHRIANPCIGRDRADLVLAGCAILEAIREIWPSQRLRVADRGLREGILTELMASDGVWRRRYRRHRPSGKHYYQKVLS